MNIKNKSLLALAVGVGCGLVLNKYKDQIRGKVANMEYERYIDKAKKHLLGTYPEVDISLSLPCNKEENFIIRTKDTVDVCFEVKNNETSDLCSVSVVIDLKTGRCRDSYWMHLLERQVERYIEEEIRKNYKYPLQDVKVIAGFNFDEICELMPELKHLHSVEQFKASLIAKEVGNNPEAQLTWRVFAIGDDLTDWPLQDETYELKRVITETISQFHLSSTCLLHACESKPGAELEYKGLMAYNADMGTKEIDERDISEYEFQIAFMPAHCGDDLKIIFDNPFEELMKAEDDELFQDDVEELLSSDNDLDTDFEDYKDLNEDFDTDFEDYKDLNEDFDTDFDDDEGLDEEEDLKEDFKEGNKPERVELVREAIKEAQLEERGTEDSNKYSDEKDEDFFGDDFDFGASGWDGTEHESNEESHESDTNDSTEEEHKEEPKEKTMSVDWETGELGLH